MLLTIEFGDVLAIIAISVGFFFISRWLILDVILKVDKKIEERKKIIKELKDELKERKKNKE